MTTITTRSNTFALLATRRTRETAYRAVFALGLAVGLAACDTGEEEPWIGEERGAREQVADRTPGLVDEEELREVLDDETFSELTAPPDVQGNQWTGWYDRDDPSGTGDWENRSLQAGVCPIPTGVECRTVTGLALWQTGENVSCSTNDGLLCLNSSQPDGVCDHDYMVRFLCPSCGNGSCDPGEDQWSCPSDCNPCGNGWCDPGEDPWSCPSDCIADTCGDWVCGFNESPWSCPHDCGQPCLDGKICPVQAL